MMFFFECVLMSGIRLRRVVDLVKVCRLLCDRSEVISRMVLVFVLVVYCSCILLMMKFLVIVGRFDVFVYFVRSL